MEEAHYDTPWEFLHRTVSFPSRERPHSDSSEFLLAKRLEHGLRTGHNRTAENPKNSLGHSSCVQSNVNHSHTVVRQRAGAVRLPEVDSRRVSSTELERPHFNFSVGKLQGCANGRDSRRLRYCEEEIIHKGIDRTGAERLLSPRNIGSFLIRVRDNSALALSIRANKGVLHIKLELRNNRWVLGEGPSFDSIASIISFYRCHELPIRGAERMLLSSPVLVTNNAQSHLYL